MMNEEEKEFWKRAYLSYLRVATNCSGLEKDCKKFADDSVNNFRDMVRGNK